MPDEPKKKPEQFLGFLSIDGACAHNLKNISVQLPIGAFTALTGVSGSGKSTLANDVIVPAIEYLHKTNKDNSPKVFSSVQCSCSIGDVIYVSQAEIGKTSRGNPASYCGVANCSLQPNKQKIVAIHRELLVLTRELGVVQVAKVQVLNALKCSF